MYSGPSITLGVVIALMIALALGVLSLCFGDRVWAYVLGLLTFLR